MKWLYSFLLLFIPAFAPAQEGLSLGVAYQYGKMFTRSGISNGVSVKMNGYSVELTKKTNGKAYWQFAHNYPRIGLAASYRNFEASNIFGHALLCIPFMDFDVWASGFGILQIRHGTGLAYATRRYNEIDNPENKLLSTKLNATSLLDIGYRKKLTINWNIKAGAFLSHISNGRIKQPNGGINSWMLYMTTSYTQQNRKTKFIRHIPQHNFKKWRYQTGIIPGFYDYNDKTKRINVNFQANALAFYQHNSRFRTGLGLEVGNLNNLNRIQPSVYLTEEVLFAHIAIRYGLGAGLLNNNAEPLYEKVGIAYYPCVLKKNVAEKLFIGTSLKAHGFNAAHIEAGIGYLF